MNIDIKQLEHVATAMADLFIVK